MRAATTPASRRRMIRMVFSLLEIDRHLLDLSRELEGHVVGQIDGRASVLSDIEALVERDANRDSLVDPPLGDLLAVDQNAACATLAEASTVVLEVDYDRVLAGRERPRGRNAVVRHVHEVVV